MRAALLLVVAVVACKSTHKAPGAGSASVKPDLSGSGDVAEARFGPPNSDDNEPQLAFAITKVYDAQTPSPNAPFHVAGGTWTYFDAHLAADPAATFTVGMPKLETKEGGFGGFSKVWLVPTTAEAGAHFVAAFAKAFHVDAPPARPGTLQALQVPIAVLGVGTGAAENGYSGRGTWDATKLFLSADDIDSAELFFNVSIAEKRGLFSEKDQDYDADDLRVLAIALRDGQPPPRTPENDPTLAARNVTFELGKQVASRHAMLVGASAKRAVLAETLDDRAVLTSVDLATGEVHELYRTPNKLYDGACDDAVEHCLVPELHGKDRDSFSSDEPTTLLALDGDKVTPVNAPGAGKSPRAKAVSPGGRFLLVDGDRDTVVLDRKTGKSTIDRSKDYRGIVGWRDESTALVTVEDLMGDLKAPKKYAAWHLDTGKLEPLAAAPPQHDTAAPDGSRTVAIGDGKVVVTPKTGAARTLQLDPRDAKYAEDGCCAWLDSRYLSFRTRQFGLIDTDAMKVAFAPATTDDEEQRVEPLPGSLRALVTKGEAMYLARIVP